MSRHSKSITTKKVLGEIEQRHPERWQLYEREPIKLGKNTVMLIQIYEKYDNLADLCWHDGCLTQDLELRKDEFRQAAQQFMLQLEGHQCPAFLMALRDECDAALAAEKWVRKP